MFVKDPFQTLARVCTLENPQQFRVGFKPSYVRVRCVRVGVGVGHFQPLPYPWCTLGMYSCKNSLWVSCKTKDCRMGCDTYQSGYSTARNTNHIMMLRCLLMLPKQSVQASSGVHQDPWFPRYKTNIQPSLHIRFMPHGPA